MNATHHALCGAAAILLVACAISVGSTVLDSQAGGAGAVAPTVVFVSVFNAGADTWTDVARPAYEFTTTFACERPKVGDRALAPSNTDGLRTDVEVAAMLDEALRKNEIQPPFVLVAHSLRAQQCAQLRKAA